MAQIRETTTRTVRTHGADELKHNLSNIAHEIGRVRDQAQQEVSALEKIRGMLDVGYLNDILRSVELLERRIDELENDTLSARDEAIAAARDLEREQDRLAKLWDAYKTQEDELERVKRDYPLMEEKLFERERTIEALRRDLARLEPLARFKDEYEAAKADRNRLEHEVDHLNAQLAKAERQIESQRAEVDSLRGLEADGLRANELEARLEEEQERLAKLYRVYEDLEGEKKDLEATVADWETWFNRMKPSFEATGKAPTSAPRV